MRPSIFTIYLSLLIAPGVGLAAPTSASCDLIDKKTLSALKLNDPKFKSEHKDVAYAKGAPQQGVDTCTYTPKNAPLPALIITATKIPDNDQVGKPTCNSQSTPNMNIASCTAAIKSTFATFTMLTKGAVSPETETTLFSHISRLTANVVGGKKLTPSKNADSPRAH